MVGVAQLVELRIAGSSLSTPTKLIYLKKKAVILTALFFYKNMI